MLCMTNNSVTQSIWLSTKTGNPCSKPCPERACILPDTVEPVLKDHPIGHKNVVCQDRWSLVTGSVYRKCRSICWRCMVCQDSGLSWQWSLKTGFTVTTCACMLCPVMVSDDTFYCIGYVTYWRNIQNICTKDADLNHCINLLYTQRIIICHKPAF